MRQRILQALAILIALSLPALPQPTNEVEAKVNDVAYGGGLLYLALSNGTSGTLVAYENSTLAWSATLTSYGAPMVIESASPYGLLVMTDSAWLGLFSSDGKPQRWFKLPLDPNTIFRKQAKVATFHR